MGKPSESSGRKAYEAKGNYAGRVAKNKKLNSIGNFVN